MSGWEALYEEVEGKHAIYSSLAYQLGFRAAHGSFRDGGEHIKGHPRLRGSVQSEPGYILPMFSVYLWHGSSGEYRAH